MSLILFLILFFSFNLLLFSSQGILTHSLGKWIGSGFTFHAWICLDSTTGVISDLHSLVRRQLYRSVNCVQSAQLMLNCVSSIQTSNGTGFEAFFTCDSMLTIAVMMKKEYYSVQVQDHPILDSRWVSGPRSTLASTHTFTHLHSIASMWFTAAQRIHFHKAI